MGIYAIAFIPRIIFSFMFFIDPIWAICLNFFLDLIDYRIVLGYKGDLNAYKHVDKYVDLAVYSIFTYATWQMFGGEFGVIVLLALLLRILGTVIVSISKQRKFYVLFPNIVPEYIFAVVALSRLSLVNLKDTLSLITILILIIAFKLVFEYFSHWKVLGGDEYSPDQPTFLEKLLRRGRAS